MDPVIGKILCFAVGMGGAVLTVFYLKGTELYVPALMACGSMFTLPVNPSKDNQVKDLSERVRELLTSLPPKQGPRA